MLSYSYDRPLRSGWFTQKHCAGLLMETVGRQTWFRRCPICKERMWTIRTFQKLGERQERVGVGLRNDFICLSCNTRVYGADIFTW